MSVFHDVYGELYGYRVAAAALVAAGLAIVLAGLVVQGAHARAKAEPADAISVVVATPGPETVRARVVSDKAPADGDDAEPTPTPSADEVTSRQEGLALEGEELLTTLTKEARQTLRTSLEGFCRTRFAGEVASAVVLGAPVVSAEDTRVYVRLTQGDARTWVQATLKAGSAWEVAELLQGVAADPLSPVPLKDAALLATWCAEPAASEISRQMLASGLEGAEASWTTGDSVRKDAQATHLTIWCPRQEGAPVAYAATYDLRFCVLELSELSAFATTEGQVMP